MTALRESGLADESKPATKETSTGITHAKTATSTTSEANESGSNGDEDDWSFENTIPKNETPEEIALRREMLKYSMEEVGAVVAELDFEEGEGSESELDDDEYDDEEVDGYDSDAEGIEDEDQFGRTTRRVLDDEYRQKMLELEQKLGARSMIDVGPEKSRDGHTEGEAEDDEIGRGEESEKKRNKSKAQKGVRFADNLDVQEAPPVPPSVKAPQPSAVAEIADRPIATTIVERQAVSSQPLENPQAQRKVSRFKASRSAQAVPAVNSRPGDHNGLVANGPFASSHLAKRLVPATQSASNKFISISAEPIKPRKVPEGPPGKTHAEALIERPLQKDGLVPVEPDEFDPELINQQIKDEYNKTRNRMIQRQDGFMEIDKEDLEDESGRPKMSRFKAARLARS